MQRLDQGVNGILLCVDKSGIMQGILTDGDIRRSLLKGAQLSDSIQSIMNKNFVSGKIEHTKEENLELLSSNIKHVPILDDQQRPVDLLSWSELWRLPVTTPSLGGNELKYVANCIETVWISSQGGYIKRFQDEFTAYHNGGMALCTSSGTTALHLALTALGIGANDEVIVPDITFGATANVVMHSGARPIFVDIDPITQTMSVDALRCAITPKTKALIAVHLYGHPCDMEPIMDLAKQHNLYVVEDCAEALGSEYYGKKVGLLGDVGCYSFFANKVITTGEGGMVLTKNEALLKKMELYRDHGMSKFKRYWHLVPGFNYRMTNLQAAIGVAQMERIAYFLDKRDSIVDIYNKSLKKIPGIKIPITAQWARNIHWLYPITVDPAILGFSRDELAKRLLKQGIETRTVFPPLHLQPAYNSSGGSFPIAENFASKGLSLPTGNTLSKNDATRVCDAIREICVNR